MIRIAIVEDEAAVAEQLREYVERFCKENGQEADVTLFSNAMVIVEDYRAVWDIILMDIEMPYLDGMSAAQRIREIDSAVVLIFVTNMARFAIKGYEVDAMDFVLKPVKYAQFALKLKKAMRIIGEHKQRYLMLSTNGLDRRISVNDILYIEVINHRLYIHTLQGEFVIRGSLQELEAQLSGMHFARNSNSYMVNLRNVTGLRKDSVLVPGHELPLSRSRRKEFLQALSDYMGGGFR